MEAQLTEQLRQGDGEALARGLPDSATAASEALARKRMQEFAAWPTANAAGCMLC